MKTSKDKNLLLIIGLVAAALCVWSCASIGNPSGGPLDVTPPKFMKSDPEPNTTDYHKKKIEIYFDEYVNLDKPTEKIIITPPQKALPVIMQLGKKISVELKDSLIPNMTYTIDFTNSVQDNNEKNVLENFSFAFSTGSVVDSLAMSGLLLNAENLEPMPNILVGIYKDLSDTAFTKKPFYRNTMTNDRGQFWIRNIAPGTYKIYALSDMDRDYKFSQVGEAIAFNDSLYTPSFVPATRQDTVWSKLDTARIKTKIDTIRTVKYNRFIPDRVRLFLFKENSITQFLLKSERPEANKLVYTFNSPDSLDCDIRLLGEKTAKDWNVKEFSEDGKTVTYWIKDPEIYNKDTLSVAIKYLKTDSLQHLVANLDTTNFRFRNVKNKNGNRNKSVNKKEKAMTLSIAVSPQGTLERRDTLKITFGEPLAEKLDTSKINFFQKVDTVWKKIPLHLIRSPLNPREFFARELWPYGTKYKISVDSASIKSLYGKFNDKLSTELSVPEEKEYGNLYLDVSGNDYNGFGELLDNSEKILRKSKLHNGQLVFQDIKPGKYYVRYIDDRNGNYRWDPGIFSEKLQPEKVYYYNTLLQVQQYSEVEQTWDLKAVPIEKQKPLEITKNKPEEKKKTIQNTNNNNNNNRTTRNQSGGGLF